MSSAWQEGPDPSGAFWTSLRYFNIYRFIVASLLLLSALGVAPEIGQIGGSFSAQQAVAVAYWFLTVGALLLQHTLRKGFNTQLTANVLVDIAAINLLMFASGGLRSGFGVMLLVTLTAAGLVGRARLVLVYAAVASLALLAQQLSLILADGAASLALFHVGLLSAGFFTSAIAARVLAQRVVANETLALQRGIELNNQILVSQRAIEAVGEGVLVVAADGSVGLHNPRAEMLLGLPGGFGGSLNDYSPAVAAGFMAWREDATADTLGFVSPRLGRQLRARFVATGSSAGEALVLLEDEERLLDQARQLKLAALGRLTANIAHEIRNPLASITYAGELLAETSHDPADARLLKILLDNARRLEKIVRDVLELGRRDRIVPEGIDLATFLVAFLEEFSAREGMAPSVCRQAVAAGGRLLFDRAHLHQVLWNLLANALRYCRGEAGSLRIEVIDGLAPEQVELHVIDDGEGVAADIRQQVFEPFVTTHHQGTGLGLFIARELCEANGARIELLDTEQGAHFRIVGKRSP